MSTQNHRTPNPEPDPSPQDPDRDDPGHRPGRDPDAPDFDPEAPERR